MRGPKYSRFTAFALAAVLPLAFASAATAAPRQVPTGGLDADAQFAAPRAGGLTLQAVDIPGVALPASGTTVTIAADDLQIYNFALANGQVLKATIQTTDPANDWLGAVGWTPSTGSINGDVFPSALVQGATFEVYVAAEEGAGTYYLEIDELTGASTDYVLTWTVMTKAAATTTRINGGDRYSVAAAAGKTAFPNWSGVKHVIVACGEDRAAVDPLCAAGLAGAYKAPVLLVRSTLVKGKLPTSTESAIAGIKAANGGKVSIHVIGGSVSVPSAVYNRLSALKGSGGTIERINGADRYALSAAMAQRAAKVNGGVDFVLIANGEKSASFYDTLAASPISYRQVAPTMLVKSGSVPSSVKNALATTFASDDRLLISAPAYLNSTIKSQTKALFNIAYGTDRYEAAWDIAEFAYYNEYLGRSKVAVANKLPDALTGGVACGQMGGALLYTPASTLDEITALFLYWNKGGFSKAYALGGTVSVGNSVITEMNEVLAY